MLTVTVPPPKLSNPPPKTEADWAVCYSSESKLAEDGQVVAEAVLSAPLRTKRSLAMKVEIFIAKEPNSGKYHSPTDEVLPGYSQVVDRGLGDTGCLGEDDVCA